MFCNQCGTQLPENATVCTNCGAVLGTNQQSAGTQIQPEQPMVNPAVQLEQPMQGQPMYNGQPMQGQPMYNGQPMQGQPMYNGQPMQGQPIYNGQSMPNYGMQAPKSNPLAFLTAKYPGNPFPLKGVFSVKNLIGKGTTINLVGLIGALVAFISVFLPFMSADGDGASLISKDFDLKTGWVLLFLTLAIGVLYALRMDFMAFLCSALNAVLFIHVWTYGAILKKLMGYFADSYGFSFGFYFYLLAVIATVGAPFIWMKIKKD